MHRPGVPEHVRVDPGRHVRAPGFGGGGLLVDEPQTSSSTTPLTVEILGHRELVGQWAVVAGECPQDAHLPITGHQAQRRGMPSSSI